MNKDYLLNYLLTCVGCRSCKVPTELVATKSCTDVTAVEGDDVTLECHVTGSPAPTVLWYRKSVLVGQGERMHTDNVSRADAESYQCVADNGVGAPASCYSSLVVECNNYMTYQQVAGSSLTHCAVEYGPLKAARARASVIKHDSLDWPKGIAVLTAGEVSLSLLSHWACVTPTRAVESNACERGMSNPLVVV